MAIPVSCGVLILEHPHAAYLGAETNFLLESIQNLCGRNAVTTFSGVAIYIGIQVD